MAARVPQVSACLVLSALLAVLAGCEAQHLLAAANANIGAARAAFFPRVSLTAGLGTASRELSEARYERAIQVAFREVAAQSRLVAAEAARYRLARLRYEGGVASHLDLLDAQRSLFSAHQALVQLYRALGGGWAAPAAAP